MSKFYTRTGDEGYTGLLGNERVPKYHLRIEALGALDESTAALGTARFSCKLDSNKEIIFEIQKDLYHMMAEISATSDHAEKFRRINQSRVQWLESIIDQIGETIEMPAGFILPGDTPSGAALAVSRTIIRRAERETSRLLHEKLIMNSEILRYLNRLSTLCFILEIKENQAWGIEKATLAGS